MTARWTSPETEHLTGEQWHTSHDCEQRLAIGLAWALAFSLIFWAGLAAAITR